MNPGEKWGTTGLPQRYKHNDSNKECDDAHVPKRIVCIPASGEIPACISALDIISMASIDCSRYLLRLRTLYFPPGSNNFLAEAFCHGDLGQALSDSTPQQSVHLWVIFHLHPNHIKREFWITVFTAMLNASPESGNTKQKISECSNP